MADSDMRCSAPKLIDCSDHGPDSELFIVEGDSAARAVTRIRSDTNQAVLPMQGKPMNAMKARARELGRNAQFAALLRALRIELKEDATPDDLAAVPYGKFILLFDPDADGIHSRTLMLLFFYRWLRPLLDAGRVFHAHPPQWEVRADRMAQPAYATTQAHLEKLRKFLRDEGAGDLQTKRYRGLASIEPDTLSKLCVDPESRWLRPVGVDDAEAALNVFDEFRMR